MTPVNSFGYTTTVYLSYVKCLICTLTSSLTAPANCHLNAPCQSSYTIMSILVHKEQLQISAGYINMELRCMGFVVRSGLLLTHSPSKLPYLTVLPYQLPFVCLRICSFSQMFHYGRMCLAEQ